MDRLVPNSREVWQHLIDGMGVRLRQTTGRGTPEGPLQRKKCHTLRAFAITTLHRKILFLFCLFAGSIHDYKLMKKVFDPKLKWFIQMNLWANIGFQGVEKDYAGKSKIHLPLHRMGLKKWPEKEFRAAREECQILNKAHIVTTV